jgi:hypothetical protein
MRRDSPIPPGTSTSFQRKVEGQLSIAPICPIPPIPGIGEDTFFGGYNQGFIDGMAEAGVKLKNEDGEDIEPE